MANWVPTPVLLSPTVQQWFRIRFWRLTCRKTIIKFEIRILCPSTIPLKGEKRLVVGAWRRTRATHWVKNSLIWMYPRWPFLPRSHWAIPTAFSICVLAKGPISIIIAVVVSGRESDRPISSRKIPSGWGTQWTDIWGIQPITVTQVSTRTGQKAWIVKGRDQYPEKWILIGNQLVF